MSALSNVQLKCMIECDPLMSENVLGVFPADQITRLNTYKGLIVNTKPSGHEGEHWLAVYNDGKSIEIFDSFGEPNEKYSIDFKTNSNNVNYNKASIQCHETFVCGHYSIFYLFFRVRGLSFQEFMSLFSPICKMNDEYVVRFITHTFSFCLTNHL